MTKTPFIHVDNLSKTYRQGAKTIRALSGISLTIDQGDIYGIIGLSGAGKSTLIRCLATLVQPSEGAIFLEGVDIVHMTRNDLRRLRQNIGMIFQHFNLFHSKTVSDNISYPLELAKVPKEQREHRIDELLNLVGLQSKKHTYPSQLSGGEKQRVGIARALANHPKLLLCDEATSALDPKTTLEILDLLKKIHKRLGITVVLITHHMDVIKKICNKVAVIEEGSIIEQGNVCDVFSEPQHATTKHFLHTSTHEIPSEFFKNPSPNKVLLHLKFKGAVAHEPIISYIISHFHVQANILLGWIDRLQTLLLGSLVIELIGEQDNIQQALHYLKQQHVHYEELTV